MADRSMGLWLGHVEFSGYGGYPEKMASALINSGVQLRRVKFGDGTISGIVSPTDYWAAATAARRCGVRLRAGKRRGLYFTAIRYSRRVGLYIGALAFVMILALNSSRIQDIELRSSSELTASQRSQILTILNECGIQKGKSTRTDTRAAESRIMLEMPEASWVDVSAVGFRIVADVETVTPKPEMLDSDVPCNIVASRGAEVISHTVREGTLTTETGSGIPQRGLLVSGVVTDGAGNISYHHASADIIGEFTDTQEFFVPYRETVQRADGEVTEFTWLEFEDDIIPLFLGSAEVPDAVYTEQTEPVTIFGHRTPLSVRHGKFTALRSVDIVRSADDCISELNRRQSDFEENFYADLEIVSCEKTALPEESGIRLTAVYTLRGNIAQEQEIFFAD